MASILNATTTSGLVTSADNSGSLQLQTNNGTTAVTIDTSQNVGIGTSTGGAKLQVAVGTTNISGSAWNNSNFVVGGSSSTSGGFGVSYNDTTGTIIASLLPSTAWKNLTTYSNQTIFCTDGVNERMRITSDGYVGIGTSSPDQKLVVSGNTTSAIQRIFNLNGVNTYQMSFHNSVGEVGTISTGSGSTAYNTSSDYRLKENIAPMTNALATVAQLKPCTYTWKSDGKNGQGFIAHELQAVVPQCVTGEKDAVETYIDDEGNEQTRIKPQGVDTSFLVATLTAAIQELKAELDATKAEVQALKGVA